MLCCIFWGYLWRDTASGCVAKKIESFVKRDGGGWGVLSRFYSVAGDQDATYVRKYINLRPIERRCWKTVPSGVFRVLYILLVISWYSGYFGYYLFFGGSKPNKYVVSQLTYPVMSSCLFQFFWISASIRGGDLLDQNDQEKASYCSKLTRQRPISIFIKFCAQFLLVIGIG